jgi:hypothetical protein
MFRRPHIQFFPLPNESDHSGMGIAEDAGYGLLRLETREAIGIGQPTLFAHARFISHLSKNRQAEKRLPERAESAPILNTYPLGREMTQIKKDRSRCCRIVSQPSLPNHAVKRFPGRVRPL